MVFQNKDRTAEIDQGSEKLTVYPTDIGTCRYRPTQEKGLKIML